MKTNTIIYSLALLGIAIVITVMQGLYRAPRLSVVADLHSQSGVLDLSHLTATPEPGEEFSGGGTTVRDSGVHAFGRIPMNLTSYDTRWLYFREGRKVFEQDWFAIKRGRLLLGPHYNAESCTNCHHLDGRGRPPLGPDEDPLSLIVRLSAVHGDTAIPDPVYGDQLSYYATEGVIPEGSLAINYETLEGRFADGSPYTLRAPSYELRNFGYGTPASDLLISPRVAPVTFGLGLLEAIPADSILAYADPDDRDGNGITGRPNYIYDIQSGKKLLGRFGWKSNQPTLAQQILTAFRTDIGISSWMYPDNAHEPPAAIKAADLPTELEDRQFDALLFYMKLLAVPMRRHWTDEIVLRGKAVFRTLGCGGCHVPAFTTGVVDDYPELSNQTIHPYTDLLLHDMGEGLADNRPDGDASGREWRTPPLWGIGLVRKVNKHTFFLHDGRARNLEEAILWHGGEAAASQNSYRRLRREDRAALLEFLESL